MNWRMFTAAVFFLGGCGLFADAEEEWKEDFPYTYIHPSFTYEKFHYPENWSPVSIAANTELVYRDAEMEELRYAEIPYRYRLKFGEETSAERRTEQELADYNVMQAAQEGTHRQLYYQPHTDVYADLSIGQNGFQTLLQDYEGTEEWETGNRLVLVYGEDSRWAVNWHGNGVYYELLIHEEAMIETEAQVEELLDLFMRAE